MKKSFEKAMRRRDEGHAYKHDLGQHFLYDETLLEELVCSTGIAKTDGALEIGPGSGMLTKRLCPHARQVVAVEVDHDVLPYLRLNTAAFANLTVVEGDIRKQDLAKLCAPLGEDFFVIANIPYNITTPIFEMLWESGLPIRQISVMIQKEVADKLMARPSSPAYGLTSVKCQYYCEPRMERVVPAVCFTPPPKVDSAFVHMVMRREPLLAPRTEKRFFTLLRAGFNLRRKTLANALKGVADGERLKAALEQQGLSPTARAEELSLEQWLALARACE